MEPTVVDYTVSDYTVVDFIDVDFIGDLVRTGHKMLVRACLGCGYKRKFSVAK